MGSIAEVEPTATPASASIFHKPASPPRILIIGAGARGHAYAKDVRDSSNGIVVAIAEPIPYKRQLFTRTFITTHESHPKEVFEFDSWTDFVGYETVRRAKSATHPEEDIPPGVDAAFVCVQDAAHREVVEGLCKLGDIHIMCEKPLATNLHDCVSMYSAMMTSPPVVFSIGHVLRYSPHNVLLRKLLVLDRAIGDVLSVNHTEPVGWWHFTHSYVRGNWRRSDTSAQTLLTKSCHDIDILLWWLCSPAVCADASGKAHLPKSVSSTGGLNMFRRARKPVGAGKATNCLSCPVEESCKFSAKRIYVGDKLKGLATGNVNWPQNIVMPDIEDTMSAKGGVREAVGLAAGQKALLEKLAEDYDENTPDDEIKKRNWFGRCVFESDNDVCDEHVVTMTWDDDPLPSSSAETTDAISDALGSRGAKSATFHMIANTKKICDRFTHIYGTDGEISADSTTITVQNFSTGETKTYEPGNGPGHGGGDSGLARQFVLAVDKVKNHGWDVARAQSEFVACTLEEVLRSHAMVFCAEEAREQGRTLDWEEWWARQVEGIMNG